MNVLIVGGAGHVGTILRPALEADHRCRYLDLKPVPGAEDRTTVGDVNDPAAVAEAVRDQEALVFLALGGVKASRGLGLWGPGGPARPQTSAPPRDRTAGTVNTIGPAFTINVQGLYTAVSEALRAGVRRIVYASSLSVYRPGCVDESMPPDNWQPYGLSKRLGEAICAAAAQECPDATLVALRLIRPQTEAEWPAAAYDPAKEKNTLALGPQDTRRLFLAALALDRPGFHAVQASGDLEDRCLPNRAAHALLGWSPQNK